MAGQNIVNRRLAAVIVADVAGYSRLMEADEAGVVVTLKSRWATILTPVIESHGGRVVKLMGDGVLIENPSAVHAVLSAIELQKRMADANAGVPESAQIRLRVGINLGDVIGDGTDIYGEGVNIAARLERLATAGGICLSEKVYGEIRGKIDITAVRSGPLQLKNISAPIYVFSIAPIGNVGQASSKNTPPSVREFTTIAVLPFINLSGDPNDEYFADGLTEDIITELARSKHLAIVARNTTSTYKERSIDAIEIGRELDADFILEGSIRIAGSRVRATAQLIVASSGMHVFAEKFDREMTDIFAVQDEIVEAIVGRLFYNLPEAAISTRERNPTSSTSAYTLWLRGTAAWRLGQEEAARGFWQAAIAVDPNYARALANLAFLNAILIFDGSDEATNAERYRLAKHYARRAIASDKTDPAVLNWVTFGFVMLGETDEAVQCSAISISLSPRNTESLLARGMALTYSGQHEEGLALIKRACMFEPNLPVGYYSTLAEAHYLCRDFEKALSACGAPPNPPVYFKITRAACLAQLGRIDEAKALAKEIPAGFDMRDYIHSSLRMCALPDDKNLWLAGYRGAGFPT